MSDADRQRWNDRYRQGAYAQRNHPAQWLVHCLAAIAPAPERPLTCLDLACGAGRNALHLAGAGHRVYAVDISGAALEAGRKAAGDRDLPIQWIEHDLDNGLPGDLPPFGLVAIIRYLDLDLLAPAARMLKPGGHLAVDVHLATDREDVAGPRSAAFRVAPGALRQAALGAGLSVVEYREEHTSDPDGRRVALARLLAVKEQ